MRKRLTPEERASRQLYSEVRREAKRRSRELYRETGFKTEVKLPTLRELDKARRDVTRESNRLNRWLNREETTVAYQRARQEARTGETEEVKKQRKKTQKPQKPPKPRKKKQQKKRQQLSKDDKLALKVAQELGIPGIDRKNAKLFKEYIETRNSQTAYDLKYTMQKMADDPDFDINQSQRARRVIPSEVQADFEAYLESRQNQKEVFDYAEYDESDPFEDLF